MGKGKKQTTTTQQRQRLDPRSQQFVDQMRLTGQQGRNVALGHPGSFFAGPHEAQMGALASLGHVPSVHAGSLGFSPSQMDPSRAQAFFNPFEQQVVQGVQSDFDRQRQGALTMGAQEATKAGAFGGSRSGILQAQALGDVNRNEAQTLAGLRHSGFQNAQGLMAGEHQLGQQLGMQGAMAELMARLQASQANQQGALQSAGMQFGMGSALHGIDQQQAMEPLFRHQMAQQFMNQGLGPTGMDASGRQVQKQSGNLFNDLMGAGMVAGGLGLFGRGGGGGGRPFFGGGGGVSFNPPTNFFPQSTNPFASNFGFGGGGGGYSFWPQNTNPFMGG